MDTGNNTAGKTAPERYVSEKAFEELPDTFQKLAELLGEDQFELVAVNDEKDPQDQKAASESAFSEAIAEKSDDNMYRVDSYVKNGEIRLVYLMNDAVESFLVFGNARMTGVYKPDYEGEILADLSRQGREYILVVHQDDSVVTLFFETLSLEKHLYDYSRIGHFWVEGYEYLRQLEYRLAILRDKYQKDRLQIPRRRLPLATVRRASGMPQTVVSPASNISRAVRLRRKRSRNSWHPLII